MAISTGSFLLSMSASLWGVTILVWLDVTFTAAAAELLITKAPEADCMFVVLVIVVPAMLVVA